MAPLIQIAAVATETLDAAIFAIGNINNSLLIDGDGMRNSELAWPVAGRTPFSELFPLVAVFNDPSVRVTIRNQNSIMGKGYVGGTAEGTFRHCWESSDMDLQKLCTLR